MKDIDISAIAQEAADNAVGLKTTGGYFSDNFKGLSDEAKQVMARAYLARHKSFDDEEWVDIYKDWIKTTDEKLKNVGINKMIALSKFYFEKVKLGTGDTIKKAADERVKEFTYGIYS